MYGEVPISHYIVKETGAYVASKTGILIPRRESNFHGIHFKMKNEFIGKISSYVFKYICDRCLHQFIKDKQCDTINYDSDDNNNYGNDKEVNSFFINLLTEIN